MKIAHGASCCRIDICESSFAGKRGTAAAGGYLHVSTGVMSGHSNCSLSTDFPLN